MKIEEKKEIVRILSDRGATKPCHRCGKSSFTIIHGYSYINLQDGFKGDDAKKSSRAPVVNIACDNCGAITAHALGALDLMPNQGDNNE